MGLTFYDGTQFPAEYRGDLFAAEHGSWNRANRTGYKVVRAILRDGQPTGEYEDFLTGLVTSNGAVWGRPVGVATAHDGALLIGEDGNGMIWRVTYPGAAGHSFAVPVRVWADTQYGQLSVVADSIKIDGQTPRS